ncbi:MAG: ERCC4-type nuclease [Thermoplasmata archaeon]|nr:ERCC4-type nuclease [Thermoplasmata archaeon]
MVLKVILDHREKSILPLIEDLYDNIELSLLPFGDIILVTDKKRAVVIERKSSQDFISSIRSNRLWEQLLKMMKAKEIFDYRIKRKILLVHGRISDYLENISILNQDRGENALSRFWASLSGAMLEIIYVYGIPIIFVEDDEAIRHFLRILANREENGLNDKAPKARWFRRKRISSLPEKDEKLFLLSSLPYIGDILANNLLEHFGSIANIANASIEELKEVEGIGEKKATKIYNTFH